MSDARDIAFPSSDGNDVIPISDKPGHLSKKQRDFVQEMMVEYHQNKSVKNAKKAAQILGYMRRQDEEGFIDTMIDVAAVHPDLNAEGEGFKNFMDWLNMNTSWHKIKHQKRFEAKKHEDKMLSIDAVNALRQASGKVIDVGPGEKSADVK